MVTFRQTMRSEQGERDSVIKGRLSRPNNENYSFWIQYTNTDWRISVFLLGVNLEQRGNPQVFYSQQVVSFFED